MATIYDAILSLNNMGVYLEKTGGLGIRGYPPFKKLRALGVEWQQSMLF